MIRRGIVGLLLAATLTGCLGNNGLRGELLKFNLTAVEHRWAREGVFVVLFPAYLLCSVADLLVLNSIEFWSGSNPINGKSPLVDIPRSEIDKLGLEHVEVARIERLDESHANLYVEFATGDRVTFDVLRDGDAYTVSYAGVEFFQGKLRL